MIAVPGGVHANVESSADLPAVRPVLAPGGAATSDELCIRNDTSGISILASTRFARLFAAAFRRRDRRPSRAIITAASRATTTQPPAPDGFSATATETAGDWSAGLVGARVAVAAGSLAAG